MVARARPRKGRRTIDADVFEGFSPNLQSAVDLLRKLERDYERVSSNPNDGDAAFDFFVTAEHLPEWFFRGDAGRAATLKRRFALLRVVSHLASGAKHFRATGAQHKAVRGVRPRRGAFQPGAFQGNAFDVGGLVVDLDGNEAHRYGRHVEARRLAALVLSFWARRIK